MINNWIVYQTECTIVVTKSHMNLSTPQNVDDLLKYVKGHRKCPRPSSVWVHIYSDNDLS